MIIAILVSNLTRPHETPQYTITAMPRGELEGTAIKLNSKTGETHHLVRGSTSAIVLWAPIRTISQEDWDKVPALIKELKNSKKD